MFDERDLIHPYSRKQALEDGVLVDATSVAQEAGFRIPLALTSAVWTDCVAWNENDAARGALGQTERGRVWDVVWLAAHAARVHRASGGNRAPFSVMRIPRGGRRAERVELVVHIGPGDAGEPVATIMLPLES
jgi:hypothetical protein